MPVQTFEAVTDDKGEVRLTTKIRLPAHTKVCVVIPEQTVSYEEIVPETVSPATMRFPSLRVLDGKLAKRLVKTIVEDARAEL